MNRYCDINKYQSGLTLLEIMITVVILSLGLLGLAGLQMTGLKNNRNAYYQTVAAQVVQDIGERLRVDKVKLNAITTTKVVGANLGKCEAANPSFDDRVNCLVAALPGGQAWLTPINNNNNPKTLLVAVRWTDLQLNNNFGWGSGTTTSNPAKPDSTACGSQVRNMSCYYAVFRP